MWRSSFLVNLEACRLVAGNFTIKWTHSQVFFDSMLSSLHAPLMLWLKPAPPSNFEEPPPSIGGGTASSCSQHLWETLLNGYDIQKLGSFAWGNRSSRIYLKKFCSGAQDRDIYYWILLFFIVWILNIQEWTIFFSVLHKLAGTIFAFSRLEKESVL